MYWSQNYYYIFIEYFIHFSNINGKIQNWQQQYQNPLHTSNTSLKDRFTSQGIFILNMPCNVSCIFEQKCHITGHSQNICQWLASWFLKRFQCKDVVGKSTALHLCKNAFKSLSEANARLQLSKLDIYQVYLASKVTVFLYQIPLFATISLLQLGKEALSEETQRGNFVLKRL